MLLTKLCKILKPNYMKNLLILFIFFYSVVATAQSVAINNDGTTAVASAVLDLKSTTKGFLPPRMTIAERDLIESPATGLLIWCTNCGTTGAINIYNGTIWASIAAVPDIPTIGTVIGGVSQVTVPFTASENSNGLSINGYTVTSNPGGITATGTDTPIIFTGLINGTAYTFTVTATNSVGTSLASAASNSVIPAGAPDAPTIGFVTAGTEVATVPFTAPSNNRGATITSYTATSSSGDISNTIYQSESGTITVTGLTKGTAYTFTVTATNSAGTSLASAASNSVIPVGVPNAPVVSNDIYVANERVRLSFTAPSNNGGSTITSYTATSNPGNISNTIYQSESGTITVTGLTNGTAYTFMVTATNSIGTSTGVNSNSATPIVKVLDLAHGGTVFYIFQPDDAGYIEGEVHGLVAALEDNSSSSDSASWGVCNIDISGADGTEMGTGAQNTIDMVAAGCAIAGTAVYYCVNLTSEGYSDWFLPSKDVLLYILEDNISLRDDLNMGYNRSYWSSTEYNSDKALVINYWGDIRSWTKDSNSSAFARPIRAF
jgi:hypothetical protein